MDEKIYCLCGQLYDAKKFMIQCDMCRDWFHGSCVGIYEHESSELDKYHCPRCQPTYGPPLYKVRTNWHRYNLADPDADGKPVQTGTAVFVKELKSRHFSSPDDIVTKLSGKQLTLEYLQEHGFEKPIIVHDKEGLKMNVPPETFTVLDVERFIGPDREVDVIDVTRQSDLRMKLSEFVEYFYSQKREKILNVISLEFSDTRLGQLIEAPLVARALDWVNYAWPKNLPEDAALQRPEVQKYCLMGVQDSFTDFHVDFGGSSVWYHILKGEKIFYLIKPTTANLSLYQRWMTSTSRSETFFGDQVDSCHKLVMKQGETMLIPTGWIHAVLTPVDSLVFGGNFLHSLNIPMQLQMYEIEKKIRTPAKFRFPDFEATNWYAAKALLQEMQNLNIQGTALPNYLLVGIKALILTLKQWNQDKDFNKSRREEIPEDIDSQKLLKELSKEIRHAERFLNSLNPPKPERESKRKKRKPINKDFVDFSESQNSLDGEFMTPLKLTIRTVPKSPRKSGCHEIARPPLKLTLPKPVMYPYSSNDIHQVSPMKLEINTDSIVFSDYTMPGNIQPCVRIKSQGDLNIRLAKKSLMRHNGLDHEAKAIRFKPLVKSQTDSIYDFHEESDDDKVRGQNAEDSNADDEDDNDNLIIAENHRKKKKPIAPFRMKIPHSDFPREMGTTSKSPKNGIDELLKASGYALESNEHNLRLADIESVQASPSTREAIVGMLSISQQSYVGSTNGSDDDSTSRKGRRARVHFSDDYGENIDKVHQDDDYIYPTLDASDDDDLVFKPRGKRKLDEAWSPKARVGPLVPKTDRPTREGTKKQSVEKGLEAAAAKRAGMPAPKRSYIRKKVRVPEEVLPSPTNTPLDLSPRKLDIKSRKPRKGMATPKQRLGRILKIHKLKF